MRAIIVGAGASGLLHAMSYRAHGVSIAGVYDVDPGKSAAFVSLVGGCALPSLEACDGVDARFVSVTSPPSFHVDQAARLAREGRVLVVEKPVATTLAGLDALAAIPGCVPVLQWRKGRAAAAMRAAVARGDFGPTPTVAIDLSLSRDEQYFARGRSTVRGWGCGALLSIGIHAVDLAVHVLGERPVRVTGALGWGRRMEVETAAVTSLELASGALVSMRVTFDGGADDARFVLSGDGATAELSGTEEDLTARPVEWRCRDDKKRESLVALERSIAAPVAPPLVVPFLGDVVAQARMGAIGGPRVPDVAATYDAHLAILRVYERAASRPADTGSPGSCRLPA